MNMTREEQVELMQMPYTLLLFRTSNNESQSLFEEEPDELYFQEYSQAKEMYDHLAATMEDQDKRKSLPLTCWKPTFSHIMLMKYGLNGNPEDGDCLDEWDDGKGNMFEYYNYPSEDDVCSDCEEDPCETCIVCVDKYDYKNTGKMCLVHDPRDLELSISHNG